MPEGTSLEYEMFQSTPGFSAGRNGGRLNTPPALAGFNPLPAFRPGETKKYDAVVKPAGGFNPLPAFRPGETPPRQPLATKANLLCVARTSLAKPECAL